MKNNQKFARAAQFRRLKAAFITLIFHAALFATVTYGTDGDYKKLLPDVVKEWLKIEMVEEKTPSKKVA